MRALVTGGAGFVGSSLVDRLLAEGHQVDVVDDLSSGTLANLAEARTSGGALSFHRLDVRDVELVDLFVRRRPDVVYHLVGAGSAVASVGHAVEDAAGGLLGSLRVIEAARAAAAEKIVVALSGADLYGEPDDPDRPSSEGRFGQPRSPHSVSLRSLLAYLSLFRERDGLEYSALATGEVYGPREPAGRLHSVLGLIEGLANRGTATILGNGSATRDYVYVDDVVDALSRAAVRGSGLLLNVATGRATSGLELFEIATEATGVRPLPRLVAWPDGAVHDCALDPARAGIHLGWRPWTSLESGVTELARLLDAPRHLAPRRNVQ